jgi:hypothetical protein
MGTHFYSSDDCLVCEIVELFSLEFMNPMLIIAIKKRAIEALENLDPNKMFEDLRKNKRQ